MWSAVTKPTVIASKRHAPIKRGGAGDGMSKNRHPAPMTSPRTSPMMAAVIVLPSLEREAIATEIPQVARMPNLRTRLADALRRI